MSINPSPASRRRRGLLAGGVAVVAVIGLFSGQPWASAAADITYDTGSGMTFVVNSANGDITSLKHNGTELAQPGQAAGQFESGWSSATVTSKTFSNGALL